MALQKDIFESVEAELEYAIEKHGTFKNYHEALGALTNEMYELNKGINERDNENIKEELQQIAAVAIKGLMIDG